MPRKKVEPVVEPVVDDDAVVEAAEDMNDVLCLDPEIDVTRPIDVVRKEVLKSAELILYTDIADIGQVDEDGNKPPLLSEETQTTLTGLGFVFPGAEDAPKPAKESKPAKEDLGKTAYGHRVGSMRGDIDMFVEGVLKTGKKKISCVATEKGTGAAPRKVKKHLARLKQEGLEIEIVD